MRPSRERGHVNAASPPGSCSVAGGLGIGVVNIGSESRVIRSKGLHHTGSRSRGPERVRRVDDSKHSFFTVSRSTTVEEERVSVVYDLREDETLVLLS